MFFVLGSDHSSFHNVTSVVMPDHRCDKSSRPPPPPFEGKLFVNTTITPKSDFVHEMIAFVKPGGRR